MSEQPLAIRMLHDRVLVDPDAGSSERRSGGDFEGAGAALRNASGGGRRPLRNRVTISTNRDLTVMVERGAFRRGEQVGAEQVLVAGQIAELGEGGEAAVDGNVFDGMNVVDLLTTTLEKLGA